MTAVHHCQRLGERRFRNDNGDVSGPGHAAPPAFQTVLPGSGARAWGTLPRAPGDA